MGKTGTEKEGQAGTYDEGGSVPDSVRISQTEYDAWVAAQPVPVQEITQLQSDIAALSSQSLADAMKGLAAVLERLRSGER